MNQNSKKSKREIIEDLLDCLDNALDANEERWIVQEVKPKIQWCIVKHKNKLPNWLRKAIKCYNNTVSQERYQIIYKIQNNQVLFKNIIWEEDLWPL